MPTERVNIIVTSSGTVTVRKEIEGIGTSASKAAGGVDLLKGAVATLVSGYGVSSLISYSDAYTNIDNKLKLVTNSTTQLAAVNQQLFATAQENRTSYEALVGFFQKASGAIGNLGGSLQDAIDFTDTFTKAVQLSGVSVQTGEQAVYQFTQALNKGKLDGDEFKSVMEGLPYVVNLLTKELGVTKDQLYSLSSSGALSVQQLVGALTQGASQVTADFAKMTPTIGSALTVLDNAFLQLIGTTGQATGASALFANSIIFVANNLGLMLTVISPLIAALTILAIQTVIGLVVTAFSSLITTLARLAIFIVADLIPSIVGLTIAMLTNPLFLVGTAVAISAIAGLVIFRNELGLTDEKLAETKGNLVDFFTTIGQKNGNNIDINLQGTSAAEDLKKALSDGGVDSAGKVVGGHQKGGKDAADLIRNGLVSGASTAAATLSGQQAAGVAEYERLNGVAIKGMGDTIVSGSQTGGDYIYNQVTGATTKGAGEVQQALSTGGTKAGASMEDAIVRGGNSAAATIFSTIESAYATLGNILDVLAIGRLQGYAAINKSDSEARLNNENASKAQAEAENIRKYGSGSGGGTNGRPVATAGGSSGGSGGGANWAPISLNNINVVDPRDSLSALDTGDGVRTMLNVIKTNQSDFRDALGAV